MDNFSEHSKRELPNTARVSDKIIEYYKKFGQDRDLEKFMRIYSPASSQESQHTEGDDRMFVVDSYCKQTKCRAAISSTKSCEALAIMPSIILETRDVANSKSLPNFKMLDPLINEKCYSPAKDVIVDINIETLQEKGKDFDMSAENLITPKKSYKNAKTQTPESVAKTHKRLEWDSLGDVGYVKSISTDNITTMERSLLRKFFKENSVTSEPGTSLSHKKESGTEENKALQKIKTSTIEHSTPPLASSTLVVTSESGAKPKMITKSTSSTSLNEKFEKCIQTSATKQTTVRSQQIQCSISSSNSILEGTATPSSFEYYSSSKSRSSKSSDLFVNTNAQNKLSHPFITSISDLLNKKKALIEKNEQKRHQFNSIRELQKEFQATLDENKENQSDSNIKSVTATSFSLNKQAPELDLGIQLICALVDAKSINGKQKKQLIHDIIKRISLLEAGDQTTVSSCGGTTTNSSDCYQQHVYDSVNSNVIRGNKQRTCSKLRPTSKLTEIPIRMEQANVLHQNSSTSTTNTSDNRSNVLAADELKKNKISRSSNFTDPHEFQLGHCKADNKKFPYKKSLDDISQKANNTKVPSANVTTATISNGIQSELIMIEQNKATSRQTTTNCTINVSNTPEPTISKALMENKINRCTQTSKTSTTSTSVTTTPDLTTQRFLKPGEKELNCYTHTDTEQPSMREWLNPLTQSEIEYEEKKQIEMKKKAAAQQEKLMKKWKNDCGRVQQLNWIENEIQRLECLKHLLLKDENSSNKSTCSSSVEHSLNIKPSKTSTLTDKLYDTVYSDKSSPLSEAAEQKVHEIEIILEESQDDIRNVKDKIKSSKDSRKHEILLKKHVYKVKPTFRTINENISVHEKQQLTAKQVEMERKQPQQRGKIDTPSTEKSQESESLRELIQHRKREFMEAYQTKKQHHYEILKQQQKKDFQYSYLNTQNQLSEKTSTATTDSDHYSVPHTLIKNYVSNSLPLTPRKKEGKINTFDERIIYYTATANQKETEKPKSHEIINNTSTSTNNIVTTSSSSIFCMSSDVSVSMGSQNTSSSPTTTHQYDDVATAAAVAVTVAVTGASVQTTDSILHSKPFYGAKSALSRTANFTSTTTTACIQVKPKGIAYMIEFNNDNKHDTHKGNSVSYVETSSNNMLATANNLKPPLLTTEPQLSLQEHLEKRKPTFLQHSKERRATLKQMQLMRQEREHQLREIIDNTSFNSLDRRLNYLPPPPTQKVRVLKTKEMKALTNKRFANLPEVVAKHEREIEEKKRRSNRILRDVFNRRLQKRVRGGKLSLNHSKTVI